MSSEQRFERDLPNLLADLVVGPTPDYRDDVLARTRRMRQRPAWTLPERWLPMAVVDRRRILSPNVPWRALVVLGLLAVLLVAALAVYVGSHQRRLPPPFGPAVNGAIVYAKDGDIYTRDTPSSAPRLFVGGATKDEGATFSRQGDRFMFFRVVRDTESCDCEVWIANADGSDVHKLAGGPYHNPTAWDWSPDGTKIVIGYDLKGMPSMAIIPTDGSAERTLKLNIPVGGPVWRPPLGDQILFRGGPPDGDGALYVINPDGSHLVKLALPAGGIGGRHDYSHGYAWSPDGRRIAYCVVEVSVVSGPGDGLRIHVADVSGTGSVTSDRRLEFDPKDDNELNPGWLPSGDRIVFQVFEGASNYLELGDIGPGAPATGKLLSKMGPDTSDGINYEIAPDGHSLLVLFLAEQKTWVYDLDHPSTAATPADLGPLDTSSYQRVAP